MSLLCRMQNEMIINIALSFASYWWKAAMRIMLLRTKSRAKEAGRNF